MDSRKHFKTKLFGACNVEEGRAIRTKRIQEFRKQQRAAAFTENRKLEVPEEKEAKVKNRKDLMSKLQQWKIDRDKLKKREELKKKPAFKVGVVHHNVSSPFKSIFNQTRMRENVTQAPNKSKEPKRITKATEKRIKRKQEATKNLLKQLGTAKKQANVKTNMNKPVQDVQENSSHVINKNVNEVAEKSPKMNQKQESKSAAYTSPISEEPAYFSPYIVQSRGKDRVRKEQQERNGIGRLSCGEIPTKDTVMKNLNISVEEEERTAQYFKYILEKETNRFVELCNKWTEIKSDSDITEEAQCMINQAVGQTCLLINKKFQRFHGLVCDCEMGKGEMLVTCKDLQGFWDMMHMEIRDCDLRFERLEKLYLKNWVEDVEIEVGKPIVKKRRGQIAAKPKSTKPSALSAFILAARKNNAHKRNEGENLHVCDNTSTNIISNTSENHSDAQKLNKCEHRKSVSVSKPKHSPMKKDSILRNTQLPASSKRIRSPLALIKISRMCKTPEVKLDDTISYINSDQTPSKSILKRTEECINNTTKSMHKVNFDDHVTLNDTSGDQEAQLKARLTVSLGGKVDCFALDNSNTEISAKVERKLNFEDDSDEEEDRYNNTIIKSYNNNNMALDVPHLLVTLPTPNNSIKFQDTASALNYAQSLDQTPKSLEENDFGTRILRSRRVIIANTPNSANNSTKNMLEEQENKPGKTPRPRRSRRSRSEILDQSVRDNNFTIESVSSPRRSSRKSVKFTHTH